jgi:hypothetical protein
MDIFCFKLKSLKNDELEVGSFWSPLLVLLLLLGRVRRRLILKTPTRLTPGAEGVANDGKRWSM